MWIFVLVVGLGAIAATVLAWYVPWRRERRVAHARRWRELHEWQEQRYDESGR